MKCNDRGWKTYKWQEIRRTKPSRALHLHRNMTFQSLWLNHSAQDGWQLSDIDKMTTSLLARFRETLDVQCLSDSNEMLFSLGNHENHFSWKWGNNKNPKGHMSTINQPSSQPITSVVFPRTTNQRVCFDRSVPPL